MTADPGGVAEEPEAGVEAQEALDRPLAEPVRARVIEYASDILGGLPEADLPPVLRRVARFEPRRRARLAGPQIGAQLETDPGFRAKVAERVGAAWPELAKELRRGAVPPAAEPVAVAAAAYLLRPSGWPAVVGRIQDELEHRAAAQGAEEAAEALSALRSELDEVRAQHREELARLRGELRSSRSAIADLRRELHAERQRAKAAADRAEQAEAAAQEARGAADSRSAELEAENRRLRGRLDSAEAQLESARRAARVGRSAESARLRILIDVLLDAAHGLRRELALPTALQRPADLVAGTSGQDTSRAAAMASLAGAPDDDPGFVDQLLMLPHIHLLVDGYNVTQSGYGSLPLADQRNRLLTGLEGLASRTKAEITCVFDGAEVDAPPVAPAARRVRQLFSDSGETADDLIIRLVRAEPPGRPLAVVSADQEIVTAVRREGGRTIASAVLLRRLENG